MVTPIVNEPGHHWFRQQAITWTDVDLLSNAVSLDPWEQALHQNVKVFHWHVETWTKWLPFCRHYFQMRFIQSQFTYFDTSFSEVCSCACPINNKAALIRTGKWRQAITWTNVDQDVCCNIASRWPPFWQTTISNAFSWMKMIEFRFEFHWNLFPGVQLTISQQWFR